MVLLTAAAILAEFAGIPGMMWLMQGWAVFLILLGIEFFLAPSQTDQQKTTLAWGWLTSAMIVCALAVFLFQGWMSWTKTGGIKEWFSPGETLAKQPVTIPLSADTEQLVIENENGSSELIAGNRDDVEVRATVRNSFFFGGPSEVRDVQIEVYEKDGTLYVETESPSSGFFFWTQPFVNLTVLLPQDHPLDIEINQRNGNISADSLPLRESFQAVTTNGAIKLSNLDGSMRLQSSNGAVIAQSIAGEIDIRTTNGKIEVDGEVGSVKARTTNGAIRLDSSVIDDDWDLSTTNGSIDLSLARDADFEISVRTTNGSIHADDPLRVEGKQASGRVGKGTHDIKASTTNGNVTIRLD